MTGSATPTTETVIDGRYRLVAQVGEGTFGEVWRADDLRLAGRPVAVKILKPEFLTSPEAVRRFESEADALAQVQHPNVVGVLDRGQWGARRFLVTEFVEGASLGAWIADHRARRAWPDLSVALALFEQTCAGVEAAHAVRAPGAIVHRDLKPDNVLVRVQPNGERLVKILDFGIAQLGGRSGTRTGARMGTLVYMAPEQALGQPAAIGPWTDVFSLGVILCEMLTLRAQAEPTEPWWGTALRRGDEVRAMLGALREDLPPALLDLIAQCLRAYGPDRPQDASALRLALRGARPPIPQPLPEAPPARVTPPAPQATPPTTAPAPARPSWQLPARALAGLVVVGLGWTLMRAALRPRAPEARVARATATATPAAPPAAPVVAPTWGAIASDPELQAFFDRWSGGVLVGRGATPLDAFYGRVVQFRGSGRRADPAAIERYYATHAAQGGTFDIDWARSQWRRESLTSPDAVAACTQLAGAQGPITVVRAWATEVSPNRAQGTGGDVVCDRLEGRYLFRLRRVGGALQICHETWSLREGVCASCPASPACARL